MTSPEMFAFREDVTSQPLRYEVRWHRLESGRCQRSEPDEVRCEKCLLFDEYLPSCINLDC
jgi:hypothetical protein